MNGDPIVELTADGSGVELGGKASETLTASAVLDGSDLWIVLAQLDRSGSLVWGWNLADLCPEPVQPPAQPPALQPAAPAAPVAGAPAYTG